MMKFESKIYPTADIDSDFLSQIIDDYQQGDTYGYFLINDRLVPKSLLARIFDELFDRMFEYGDVWSVESLFSQKFWLSLDEDEQNVAGACVLIIIESGFAIPVPDELQIKH